MIKLQKLIEDNKKNYYLYYRYIMNYGQNEHYIEIYNDYSKEYGLQGKPLKKFRNTKAINLLNLLNNIVITYNLKD